MPCLDDCNEGKGNLCCLECPQIQSSPERFCKSRCDEVRQGDVTREEGPNYYKTMCASWEEAEG